jgi:hypothetical protein
MVSRAMWNYNFDIDPFSAGTSVEPANREGADDDDIGMEDFGED